MVRRVTFVLALAASSVAASAKDVKIGETSINLVAPPGQCELREDQPNEAVIIKLFRNGSPQSEELAVYADCQRLADVRRGRKSALGDMSTYATPKFAINILAPPDGVKQFCALMRKNDGYNNSLPHVEEVLKGARVGEARKTGVLAEEETACYSAIVQKNETNVIVTMMANVHVKRKVIYYNYISSNGSDETLAALLAKHKQTVAAVLRANN